MLRPSPKPGPLSPHNRNSRSAPLRPQLDGAMCVQGWSARWHPAQKIQPIEASMKKTTQLTAIAFAALAISTTGATAEGDAAAGETVFKKC